MATSGDVLGLTERLSGLVLPEGLVREACRPVEFRQPGFDQLFDSKTLVYDAVLVPEDQTVVLTCPPALNLQAQWQAAEFFDAASGQRLTFELIELDRVLRVVVQGTSKNTTSIKIAFDGRNYQLDVRDRDTSAFHDKKVLMTVSKDNDISWIVDWAEYYSRVHAIDSVLLLDNNSQRYSRDALLERLVAVPGISLVHVVDWPFPWGPTAGPNSVWDSNFGQHGAFEVCRWRFLRDAALVVNADVDELVIPRAGTNLFEFCSKSSLGAACYGGRWVINAEGLTPEGHERRHRNYFHVMPRQSPLSMAKWAVQPKRTKRVKQWLTHRLQGLGTEPYTEDFELGHYREISTNWKWKRASKPADWQDATLDAGILNVFRSIGWR